MAPISKTNRPAQHKQKSRKGKKAWRKNIDLTDIEAATEQRAELEITHGTQDLSSLKNDALFQVDEAGDEDLKARLVKRKQIKKGLKSREILDSIKTNSKVAALSHHKHDGAKVQAEKQNKVQGVSKRELNRLLALAGRVQGENKLKNRVNKEGLVKSGSDDLWGSDISTTATKKGKKVKLPSGIEMDVKSKKEIPAELLNMSTTSWSIPSKLPKTAGIAPVQVRKYEDVPHAGKSYNPDTKEWNELINTEFEKEKINEEKRVQLAEYRERIQHLMDTLDDNEEESSSGSSDEEEEEEEDVDVDGTIKLSINDPVKNKKKTKYQRNKARKHEEKVKLNEELKKLKAQLKQLEQIEEIDITVQQSITIKATTASKVTKERKHNRNKLGTKYGILDERLEVKFADELSDSLRKLKPEGNLLYDNVRKLQSSGKVESRIPLTRGRRYKKNITEKWTHKDFK